MFKLENPENKDLPVVEFSLNGDNNLPDTADNGSGEKKASRIGTTANSDNDILAVFDSMLPLWDENVLTVLWMSKAETINFVSDFRTKAQLRKTKGASRSELTSRLVLLDKEIDRSIEHVKNRLAEHQRSKNLAIAQYRAFGIVKERAYKLPTNREDRVVAITVLIDALSRYKFQGTDFGIDYWTAMHAEYKSYVDQARAVDGNVSGKVGNLSQMRKTARKFQNSFINIVKGNYPDTWRNVIREFGFHKEKY